MISNKDIIRNWTTTAQFFMNWVSGVNVLIQNEALRQNAVEELCENHIEMLFKFAEQFDALPTPESLTMLRPYISAMTEYIGNAVKEGSISKAASLVFVIEDSSPKIMQELMRLGKELNPDADVLYASSHIELDGGDDGHAQLFNSLSSDEDKQEALKLWSEIIDKIGINIS